MITIDKLKKLFKSLENQTITIIKNGIKFCFGICIFSLAILLIYDFFISNPHIFDVGITLFKMSLLFSIEFLICGIVVDSLKKRINKFKVNICKSLYTIKIDTNSYIF